MNYDVIVLPGAKLQLNKSALWWAEHRDVDQAADWLEGFTKALSNLANHPQQYPKIRESDLYDLPHTYRQMLYGLSNRPTHRAIFRIAESKVIVVAIRHLSQRDWHPDDPD